MFFCRLKERIKSTKKVKLLFNIIFVVLIIFFIITVFRVIWFLKSRQTMKEYLKERKENKQLVLSQVSGGKTKKNKEKKDVIGEDILGIPRYSGMIRTWYTDDGQSKMIIYEVKATKEELLKFYKKEMVSRGWKQDDKLTQGKKLLTYLKGKKEIQIIVNSNVFSKDKIATVTFLSRNIEKKQQ